MSEKLHDQSGEHFHADQNVETAEKPAPNVEQGHKQPENRSEKVEAVKKAIEQSHPKESEDLKKHFAPVKQHTNHAPANKELKKHSLNVYLGKARRRMAPTTKAFSKLIHNDTIDAISEVSAKTVFRPSGLLMGGAFTLAASSYYLYVSRTRNFQYSFTAVLLVFFVGFIIGILVEAVYKVLSKKRLN